MIVEVNDFGIEWQKSDKVVHKADFDDLINAYEKIQKIEQYLEKMNNNKCYCCETTHPKCVEENITCATGLYFNLINMIEQIVKE